MRTMIKLATLTVIMTFTLSLYGQTNFNESILFQPDGLFIRGNSAIGVSNIEVSEFETNALTTIGSLNIDYYLNPKWNLTAGIHNSKITFNDFNRDFNKIKSVKALVGINYNYLLLTKTVVYIGAGVSYNVAYNLKSKSSIDNSETEIKKTISANTLANLEGGLKYEFSNPFILNLSFSTNYGLGSNHKLGTYKLTIINQLLVNLGISLKL